MITKDKMNLLSGFIISVLFSQALGKLEYVKYKQDECSTEQCRVDLHDTIFGRRAREGVKRGDVPPAQCGYKVGIYESVQRGDVPPAQCGY